MNWCDVPFIGYLSAVDNVLEKSRGRTSEQNELGRIAAAQENGFRPLETAEEVS